MSDKKIMLCVSITKQTKMWPKEHWLKLIEIITNKYPEIHIVILHAPSDSEEFLKQLSSYKNVLITPLHGLRALASIESFSDVVIVNDGAIRHMVVALKVKNIGIFGPTPASRCAHANENSVVLNPVVDCQPCYNNKCKNDIDYCMKLVTPDMVFEKTTTLNIII